MNKDYNCIKSSLEDVINYKINTNVKNKLQKLRNDFFEDIYKIEEKDKILLESRKEAQKDKELEEYVNSIISKEAEKIEMKNSNYEFLYKQNRRGKYLFPKKKFLCKKKEKNSEEKNNFFQKKDEIKKYEFYYKVEEGSNNYLLNPYKDRNDPEMRKQVSKITKSFLLEGEIKRDLIPGPFQKQTYYLAISGLFFYKFVTKVLLTD